MVERYDRREALDGSGNPSGEGRAPGLLYSGAPQRQQKGLVGKISRMAAAAWGHLFHGKDPATVACGAIVNEECADIADRFLQQCLRNFHLHSSPSSWLAPPSNALPVDVFVNAFGGTTINAPTAVTIVSVTAGPGEVVIINRLGIQLESAAAFASVTWSLRVGGNVWSPYGSVNGPDLFNFQTPGFLGDPIILRSGKTALLEASTSAVSNQINARLVGWRFSPYNPAAQGVGGLLAD